MQYPQYDFEREESEGERAVSISVLSFCPRAEMTIFIFVLQDKQTAA